MNNSRNKNYIQSLFCDYGLKTEKNFTEKDILREYKNSKDFSVDEKYEEIANILMRVVGKLSIEDKTKFQKKFLLKELKNKIPEYLLSEVSFDFSGDAKEPLYSIYTADLDLEYILEKQETESFTEWELELEEFKFKSIFNKEKEMVELEKKLSNHIVKWLIEFDQTDSIREVNKKIMDYMEMLSKNKV